MKKYLFSFIPIHPIYCLVLSSFIVTSDNVFATNRYDTTYYYNERGQVVWCNVLATQSMSYVIKTKKPYNQLFDDIPQNDSTVQVSPDYNTAAVLNISRQTARKVEKLLRHGKINDPLVLANIIPVLDKRIIRRMYENIISKCTSGDAHRYKEHGGVVFPDGTVTCISGELSDPAWLQGATLAIKQKALVYYHSHPDGYVEQEQPTRRAANYNPNRVQFSQTSYVRTISYVQGPSRQDQESVGEGTGYVFGIRADGGVIYMYDKGGVHATLPISFVKKMYKPASRKVKRVDTYYAGLVPAVGRPRGF